MLRIISSQYFQHIRKPFMFSLILLVFAFPPTPPQNESVKQIRRTAFFFVECTYLYIQKRRFSKVKGIVLEICSEDIFCDSNSVNRLPSVYLISPYSPARTHKITKN